VRQRRWRKNETGQQWIFDPTMKVIRSKKWNNRVLETTNHSTGMGNMRCYTPTARWWQLFKYDDGQIINIKTNISMDVYQNRDSENQNIIMSKSHGKINQLWDIVYVDSWGGEPKKGELNEDFGFYVERPFHIVSMLPRRRYL